MDRKNIYWEIKLGLFLYLGIILFSDPIMKERVNNIKELIGNHTITIN